MSIRETFLRLGISRNRIVSPLLDRIPEAAVSGLTRIFSAARVLLKAPFESAFQDSEGSISGEISWIMVTLPRPSPRVMLALWIWRGRSLNRIATGHVLERGP